MIALLAAVLALAASQTSKGMPPLQKAPPTQRVAVGAELYAEHCISCHGANLIGTPSGPPLIRVGAANVDFQLATGRMPLEVPGTEPMRGPPSFSRDQIDAIVAYVTTHGGAGGPPTPTVQPSRDLTRGRVVWEDNCQQCHGATGYGAVTGFGWIAPPITPATPQQIAEAVRVGPGIMPKFNEHALPQRDLDALVAYADTFRRPDDSGGYSMVSAGPVGEGLVGWLVGVGGAVIVMLLVGETLKR
ncbi:MAG TPA: c-type cytochrome [Candidatus Limnocylindria bacterium]|nr:c-type cytochrome [Candidatus Limnocylindria bacterium]